MNLNFKLANWTNSTTWVTAVILTWNTFAFAEDSLETLNACYDHVIVAEQTQNTDASKTTVVLSEEQMISRCNQKVIDRAKTEKSLASILQLAGVIGSKSNWASAAPIYAIAAKKDQKKTCHDENAVRSMSDGIAHPTGYGTLKEAKNLMEACWPEDQAFLTHQVALARDDYSRNSLCPFLASHHAPLTSISKSICDPIK